MYRRTPILIVLCAAVAAALIACKPRGVIEIPDREPHPVAILQHFTGSDPGLKEPVVMLINSQDDLQELGSEKLIDEPINFKKQSLLLVSLGERPTGGYWTKITAVQRQESALYIQGIANRPREDEPVTQTLTYPYAAVTIKKVYAAKVRSEIESAQGELQRQPWKK